MKRFGRLMALAAVVALLPAGLAQGKAPLESTTEHTPPPGFTVDENGFFFAWEGTITGGIIPDLQEGRIEWWIDTATWTSWPYIIAFEAAPNASHYSQEVRIYDESGDLILKTFEHGTTTMANTSWRANGVVVEAPYDPDLVGRRVHESGRFIVTPDGFPVSGTSIFRIN